ncbi:MAG: M48 family metalloprotease [Steroidobacteraceae bacterium]
MRFRYFWLLTALALAACGTNPVTGKRELQLVPESQEIAIGNEQYAPSRQMQGGDLVIDPELTAYINSVGQKLAAVADRKLPYEFSILNNSVPNAWALPGGKIALNRGLLAALRDEAELAAVLGHEITHAAAGHGRQAMQRGLLLQAAAIGLQLGVQDNRYSNLIVGGATLGANLITQKYTRDAEREADHYGMQYMKRAGYDPVAAVELQRIFVALQEGKKTGWLEGMFASHPPSEERVLNNQQTAAALGAGGELGREQFDRALAALRRREPAYQKYDEGVAALVKGDGATAQARAREALAIEPQESKFHELLGDIEMSRKNYPAAIRDLEKARALNPGYFKPYLVAGLANYELHDTQKAAELLNRSMEILPTATGSYYLARLAQSSGNVDEAVKYFQMAAASDSDIGQASARELAQLDLPRNPGRYVQVEPRVDSQGRVWLLVANRSPVAVGGVVIVTALADPNGAGYTQGPLQVGTANAVIQPGQAVQLPTPLGPLADARYLQLVKVQVQTARVAQ